MHACVTLGMLKGKRMSPYSLQLFDCAHFFCEACALAHFGDRSTAPCPTCRADVHANKIFQGSANLTGGASLAAWEDPTYAQVGDSCAAPHCPQATLGTGLHAGIGSGAPPLSWTMCVRCPGNATTQDGFQASLFNKAGIPAYRTWD